MSTKDDYTPKGLRIVGPYENDRNAESADLFKDIIREAFGVTDVIIAHHLVYIATEKRDGFEYQIVEEIPSADSLIFNHAIAKRIWGDEHWQDNLAEFALTPESERDALLKRKWDARHART